VLPRCSAAKGVRPPRSAFGLLIQRRRATPPAWSAGQPTGTRRTHGAGSWRPFRAASRITKRRSATLLPGRTAGDDGSCHGRVTRAALRIPRAGYRNAGGDAGSIRRRPRTARLADGTTNGGVPQPARGRGVGARVRLCARRAVERSPVHAPTASRLGRCSALRRE
jgi:hypothetical protein